MGQAERRTGRRASWFSVRKTTVLRGFFERAFLSHWTGLGLRLRYWDGREVTVGAPPAQMTLHLRSPSVFWQILRNPSLGFGNAYIDGRLTFEGDLQAFLQAVTRLATELEGPWRLFSTLIQPLVLRTPPRRAEMNARFHYDKGNAFFRLWLDPSLTYSCAYFRTEQDDLTTAQEQKRELICRKLELKPGMTLLDVGCGWGSLLFHAIERYGVRGIGVNPSREQARHIEEEARRRGLADQLTLHVADWRALGGTYDRVVSVGMYEHVGRAHGRAFHEKWSGWLKPGGVSLLHTIGAMDSIAPDPWITEHIFPGGYLPALAELASHAAAAGLIVADVENLWRHYALTLAHWSKNFAAAREQILRMATDGTSAEALAEAERFVRTWWLYLNGSEAAFRVGRIHLWQLILTKGKRPDQPLTRQGWDLRQSAAK